MERPALVGNRMVKGESKAAAMPINKVICRCNRVTKEAILVAVQKNGLTTVEQIKTCTKASSSCGGCKPLVADLLSLIQSEQFVKDNHLKPFCSCTSLTEEEAVKEMQLRGLTTVQEVRAVLKWENATGCPTCTPAIQYYLSMIDPQYVDKQANMQGNINTNIGEQICKCDWHSAPQIAECLQMKFESLLTPYPIKIDIFPCMHNVAVPVTEDIGLIGIDRGWEIYVGGSSGHVPRSGKLLCISVTKEEAIEIVSGFIQYYRETANYRERTWQWLERAGLIHVREVLFDDELRQQLLKRLREDESIRKKRVGVHD
ncbi:(2Fe-2S)-binding protein [Neobacillus sp. SAB-20_R2A]|uniref:(2Fe-2S)-binding protein n=1 Tax=Neobacillus sp. SAB-20_R2A TaxID=3120519 RepID=UPI003C6DF05A